MSEIMVSMCIATFNQKDYIADAIEGCLKQKTKYTTEILIRDDCSTDGTREIIQSYQEKYPDQIRLILEEENQYSKGVKIFPSFVPYARGKYMALNEGDDFWNSEDKIEKQISFLEAHEEYSLITSGAFTVNDLGERIGSVMPRSLDTYLTTAEIITGNGDMVATNSMVFRSKYMKELPEYFFHAKVEDYPLIIFLSTKGKVRFLAEELSSYRVEAKGSWTRNAMLGDIIQTKIDRCKDVVILLKEIDAYYDFKYHDAIAERVMHFESNQIVLLGDCKRLKREYPERYKNMTGKEKAIMFFKFRFPSIYLKLKRRML